MDIDDALPPPIRRSPRATLEAHKQRTHYRASASDDPNEELDEAAPPPIAWTRSSSIDSDDYSPPTHRPPPLPDVNPLRSHPVDDAPPPLPPPRSLARKSSCLFRELKLDDEPSPDPAPVIQPPASRRHPRGLVSYRNNKREINNTKRLPPHLRRQTSLETINSVTTTASEDQSEYGHDPPEAEAPSSEWYTLDDDSLSNPPPSIISKPSSTHSSTYSSTDNSRQSSTPAETPLEYASLEHHTPQSLFKKMLPRKLSVKSQDTTPSPTRLVIEKSTTFDRSSHYFTPSGPSSLPSEEQRSLDSTLDQSKRSRSESKSSGSSKWSSSDFDTSTLSEAELKRCKKKGINPALYAEMRAARKGKWTSPIAGNTFL